MRFLNKWIIIIVVSLLAFIGYFYYYVTSNMAIDFSLNNWDGETVSMHDLRGKVVVLTFSFAYCSVRCPVITVRLSSLDDVMNAPEDVLYLHVSVDPEMDTHERRREYFSLYKLDVVKDNRWMFVSGQKNELSKLWKFYNIDIEKIESTWLPEGYYMEYTSKIVIIDKKGFIKDEVDFFFLEDEIAKKIEEII
ncbi:MAG: SCO family protein [Thermodesulfovibrionia bacterium]|nr:SCO family protein [Thermodesulfovibrionia bacterium]